MRAHIYLLLMTVLAMPALPAAPIKAGAAVADITPKDFPMNMPGGFSANAATSAHDPLTVRALVLDDGQTKIALVVIDHLSVPRKVSAEAKELASKQTGIPVDHIMVSATHTHTGVSAADELVVEKEGGPKLNDRQIKANAYRQIMFDGISQAIIQANAKLRPAAVGVGVGQLPHEVFNRRWYLKAGKMEPNPFGDLDRVKMNPNNSPDVLDRPAGPTDPALTILSVQDDRRKALALYANYSLHYVGGIPARQVSADYYGEFARVAPARFGGGEDFVAMMSNGTSGDINNIPFGSSRPPRAPFEQVRIVASEAADAAWSAWRTIPKHEKIVPLGMVQRVISLKYRRPSAEDVAKAKAVIALKDKTAKDKLPRLADNYARSVIGAAERPEESIDIILQAVRVGDFAICGVPFETFAETGLELKKKSPFAQTMVVGLANGRHGYLPTPEQHELGGYETWIGTNVVQKDASVIIVKNLVEMMAGLK